MYVLKFLLKVHIIMFIISTMLRTIIKVHFEGFIEYYSFLFEGLQNILKGI